MGCRKMFKSKMDIFTEKMAEVLAIQGFEGLTVDRKSQVDDIAVLALKIG